MVLTIVMFALLAPWAVAIGLQLWALGGLPSSGAGSGELARRRLQTLG